MNKKGDVKVARLCNGSNMVCAITKRLEWNWIPYFGHNLHSAVKNAIQDDTRVTRALGICRKLISLFSHSWIKIRELIEAQQALSLPQYSLVADCAYTMGLDSVYDSSYLRTKRSNSSRFKYRP